MLVEMTEEEFESLKQAHLIQDTLLQILLEGGDIYAILKCLAEHIGDPVAVADDQWHFIASHPKGEHGDRLRREAIRRGGTVREILDAPIVGALFKRVTQERRVTLFPAFPAHGMEKRRLMAPILAGKDILGYVTVLEESQPFQDSHAAMLQQAALILAVELLNQRAVLEAEMRLRADFLRDLFAENYISRETIGLRASLLGINLFRPWDLLVIEPDDAEALLAELDMNRLTAARARLLEVVRRLARARSPGSIVIVQSESIVVLRPAGSGPTPAGGTSELADALREQIRHTFRETGRTVSVGIGGRCEGLADFSQRYAEARRALDVTRSLGHTDRTQTLESLGVVGILYQRGNSKEMLGFALRVLGPILEYDRRRRAALVDTLDAYLTENGALRRTAARLNVHLNTLRGRLERIQETAQIDLRDAKARLNLQLALEIYRLGGSAQRHGGGAVPVDPPPIRARVARGAGGGPATLISKAPRVAQVEH